MMDWEGLNFQEKWKNIHYLWKLRTNIKFVLKNYNLRCHCSKTQRFHPCTQRRHLSLTHAR